MVASVAGHCKHMLSFFFFSVYCFSHILGGTQEANFGPGGKRAPNLVAFPSAVGHISVSVHCFLHILVCPPYFEEEKENQKDI